MADVDAILKPLSIKDLRIQARARQLSPAGGIETLRATIKENMLTTQDFALKTETGADLAVTSTTAGLSSVDVAGGRAQNNYARPAGQNIDNFLTDKPSSRVLAPPGGASQIVFGDAEPVAAKAAPKPAAAAAAPPAPAAATSAGYNLITGASSQATGAIGTNNNNYARPAGQNVGNFLTDKPSSRVLAPPGGASQIQLG